MPTTRLKSFPRWVLNKLGFAAAPLTDRVLLQELISALAPQLVGLEFIRVGGDSDGGYLLPDDLDGVEGCFSPGVGGIASFEAALMEWGIRSFLADASVDGPPSYLMGAHFTKKHLASISTESTISLDDWVASSLQDSPGDLLLQMDIEGAEYECLMATSFETLRRFRIIVVELHHLCSLDQRPFFDMVRAAMTRVLTLFDVVHLHPNNFGQMHEVNGVLVPDVVEVTLIRKDRGQARAPVRRLPHRLDKPNRPSKKDITLPPNWLGG